MTFPLIHLPHRAVLSIGGPDTLCFLDRLVTHTVRNWSCGEVRYGALLTPQGKIIADYLALRTPDGLWLDVARDGLPVLESRLQRLRLRSDVRIRPCPHLQVCAGVQPVSGKKGAPEPNVHTFVDKRYRDGRVRAFVDTGTAGYILPDDDRLARASYHRDRICNGVPEQGVDFGTGAVFPTDINMDRFSGLDFGKGCFIGQEVVSRMRRRGKIRKRSITLVLPKNMPCQSGADVNAGGLIGVVTSRESEYALAIVRIDRLARATVARQSVAIGDTPVTVRKNAWLDGEMATIL